MRKITSLLLSVIMILLVLPVGVSASEEGVKLSGALIVIPENAEITEKYAAERLEYYLEKVTLSDIRVAVEGEEADGVVIAVGNTSYSNESFDGKKDGSYKITSEESLIVINGAGNKGTINGVYAFLEKFCGCHWYEDEVIVIPENTEITVDGDINVDYTPFFEYSETDTKSAYDPEFSVANGLTGGIYKNLTAEQGGDVSYIGPSSHTLVNYYCKPETYFSEHPEYYALRDGVRTGTQLCLTNEAVKDIVTAQVLETIREKHEPSAPLQIVSITQADNEEYCQCENCAALDNLNGSQAGTMLTFVNEIARRVTEVTDYDNIAFDTFAYQYTRKAPSDVVPREDVIVRLCSIECCFGHPLDDEDCKDNAAFMNDLREWREICDRLYIWDYVLNCYESIVIHPNFGVLQRNIQIFYEHGVKGIYEQGVYYITNSDGEFSEMRTYLLSKLMQNPYLDYDECMLGYLNAVYGSAGVYLKEFIDIISDFALNSMAHIHIDQESYLTFLTFPDNRVKECDALWEKAKAAEKTEAQAEQLRRSEISWRYWKCAHYRSEFSIFQHPYLWMKARNDLYEDMVDMGITRMGERAQHDLSHNACLRLFRSITTWITLYDEPAWDTLEPVALFIYKMAEISYNFFNIFGV